MIAAWDWYEKHKDEVKFDMAVLLPCMFFGVSLVTMDVQSTL